MTFDPIVLGGSSVTAGTAALVLLTWLLPVVLFALRNGSRSGSTKHRRLELLCAVSFMASLLIQTVWLELMPDGSIMVLSLVGMMVAVSVLGVLLGLLCAFR